MNARNFEVLRSAAEWRTAKVYIDGLPAEASTIVIDNSIV
jgi:hypothetical protein